MRPPKKDDALILSKQQWRKLFLAMSILILSLYVVAMVFSLCGNSYFILNYQNDQMDKIENWLTNYKIMPALNYLFSTLEFFIICSFILKKRARVWYVLAYYGIRVTLAFFTRLPSVFNTIYSLTFYILIIFLEHLIENGKIIWKEIGKSAIRLIVAIGVTLILQYMILVIKSGKFDGQNHVMNLSATFIYAIEYDIALSVILMTVLLFINRGKGDSNSWTTYQPHGGSSQISTTQLPKSNIQKKNLTKTQRSKLRWLYTKMYLIQLGTFLLVMVLPFLLGKVFEFLVMYLSFAISRYILGFHYSLHFKKESLCISVGLVVFGVLSLAVPFFYVVLIIAIVMGVGLAVLLHLSYKYKSMWLLNKVARPDKFALLYTFFDGDLRERHIKIICQSKGLDHFQASLIYNYMRGEKLSYLAFKFNYSQRMVIYKLDEAIDKLLS